MADENTSKANKETSETPAKAAPKSYVVAFSGISDKKGNLRLKGEIVTPDELADPDFQFSIGAIVEPEPAKPAKQGKETPKK